MSIMSDRKTSAQKIIEENTPQKKRETKPKKTAEESTEAKIRFNAVLPEALYEQMRETAYQNRESMNKIVITALEQYLKRSK